MAGNQLAKIDAARQALATAKTVTEVKDIRDKAEAMRTFAEMAKDHSLMLEAGEIRIRAERRLGEMLIEQSKRGQMSKGAATKGVGRKGKKAEPKRGSSGDPQITLEELGIGKALADRARRMARMEEPEFAAFVARWREGKRLKDLLQEERMRLGVKKIIEREKNMNVRKRGLGFLAVEEEVPHEFESAVQKWEWLLRKNISADGLPERYNSISRVVADAMWRLDFLSGYAGEPHAMWKFVTIMEQVVERIHKIEKAYLAASGDAPSVVPPVAPETATAPTESAATSA